MKSFEEIYDYVKNTLSERRFYHSKCVSERAVEYAKIYGENIENARIAGIIHDIAKEVPAEKRLEICREYGVELEKIEKQSLGLIHAKLGAKIAEKDFGVNEEICKAVAFHTTGKPNMTLLEKIIYIADATSEDRKGENSKELYELAKTDLEKAIIECSKYVISEKLSENKLIHLDTVQTYNFYVL